VVVDDPVERLGPKGNSFALAVWACSVCGASVQPVGSDESNGTTKFFTIYYLWLFVKDYTYRWTWTQWFDLSASPLVAAKKSCTITLIALFSSVVAQENPCSAGEATSSVPLDDTTMNFDF
jgi:hypothetical protein